LGGVAEALIRLGPPVPASGDAVDEGAWGALALSGDDDGLGNARGWYDSGRRGDARDDGGRDVGGGGGAGVLCVDAVLAAGGGWAACPGGRWGEGSRGDARWPANACPGRWLGAAM